MCVCLCVCLCVRDARRRRTPPTPVFLPRRRRRKKWTAWFGVNGFFIFWKNLVKFGILSNSLMSTYSLRATYIKIHQMDRFDFDLYHAWCRIPGFVVNLVTSAMSHCGMGPRRRTPPPPVFWPRRRRFLYKTAACITVGAKWPTH